jgi:PAS domain S-box-containing protein
MLDHLLSEDAALRAIVEAVESEIGDHFLSSLVRNLASALRVKYAFVSEITDDRQAFRILSCWADGRSIEGFVVPLAGTPCESVLAGEIAHYPDRLQELFPEDKGLGEWGVHSYCGVPLLDPSQRVVGHLCIMHDRPMHGPRGLQIMRIFAARARAEIARKRSEQAVRESEERLARILSSAMDAIVTFDAERRIEIFNDAAERVFGVRALDVIGGCLDRFLTDGLREALDRALDAFGRAERRPYMWAPDGLEAKRSDGSEFPVEATVSHAELDGRSLFTLILRDVDEREKAEKSLRDLHLQNEYLREEIRAEHNFEEIVGQGPALRAALEQVRLVSATDVTVLILGETGTGKELVARAVHSSGRRKGKPLIKVNCAALPAGLIESELFGHEKGSFSGATDQRMGRFELAHGGTIFLDEIGDVPPAVQVRLLRVLQEHTFERVGGAKTIEVDVRVIAATNRDLVRAVADGTFREDLYYRLNVFPVELPPLRERLDDIPLLAHYFVRRFAAQIGRKVKHIPSEVVQRLCRYAWPGNIRELENVIERAVILSPGEVLVIGEEVLPSASAAANHQDFHPISGSHDARAGDSSRTHPRDAVHDPASDLAGMLRERRGATLEEIKRAHIIEVLRRTNWKIEGPGGAASLLEMNASTLRSRIKKLDIRRSNEHS